MELPSVFICIPVFILWTLSVSFAADEVEVTQLPTAVFVVKVPKLNTNASQNSVNGTTKNIFPPLNVDSSMIQRALFVLIGITVIGVLYFLVRAVRMKKPTQRKKYGLLSNQDDNMEMAHLESDEEDTTVYEAKPLRR
ncbi:hypothetical protein AAFF_G00258140 [Aldrovandia affinis]|uniref:Uncharacterized protein n=1 Tax=Aldrovandia affinis TaxID=143900 RepID=A0AAD7STM3_9TELE|nr:hypothetical protein AAFF_G00258140 [Aldrovandia affinis]